MNATMVERKAAEHVGNQAQEASREASREATVTDAPKLHATFEAGDVAHQGDLIIVALSRLPESAVPRVSRQLADGNSQGSRHMLERGEVYTASAPEVAYMILAVTGCTVAHGYIGPVFVSPATPTENDLTHPEHGNQGFPPRTVCAVVYQRSLDAEQREARMRD